MKIFLVYKSEKKIKDLHFNVYNDVSVQIIINESKRNGGGGGVRKKNNNIPRIYGYLFKCAFSPTRNSATENNFSYFVYKSITDITRSKRLVFGLN